MKVLVIVPEQLPIPPVEGGSVESCTHNIFRRMARTDDITLICCTHPKLPVTSKLAGGRYRIVRVPYANKRSSYIRAALSKVKGERFDLIQVENRPTFIPHVRKAFPNSTIVLSLHSLTFMSRLSRKRANAILRQVDGVTTVVSFLSQTMKRRYPRHAHKFKSAILGVDTEKFHTRSAAFQRKLRKKWKVNGTYNVLFVGRIVPKKGLHILLKAVAKVKKREGKTRLIAVGASWPGHKQETAYMRKVRLLSRRLGVPIRFTRYIPPSRVQDMYQLGDVFVCPTQYQEGFCTVNSEAMASGIPVIASKRGGIQEVIKHNKNGLLVSAYRSPNAFAQMIGRLKASPSLANKLKAGGLATAKHKLGWNNTVRILKKHYKSWKR